MNLCSSDKCTGCMVCVNICPKSCINIKSNAIGHLYPYINDNECVECGKCRSSCPIINPCVGYEHKKVFAAWSLNDKERETSTSGGVAAVFSKCVIERCGVVYGCTLNMRGFAHKRVDNIEELAGLKGSKYVQSYTGNIYHQVKEDLENEMQVLFIGLPCQIAGIKTYLKKEYRNLITIELICTGVPPQKLLWDHLGYTKEKPDSVRFRDESGSRLTVINDGEIVYQNPVYNDYFYMGFSKHLFFRDSCYDCNYKQSARVADITIGDFWGLGTQKQFNHDISKGVSVVISNNIKGLQFIEYCSDKLFLEERTMEEVIIGNPRYYTSSKRHKNTNKFIIKYGQYGFKKAVKICLRKERLKYWIYRNIKKIKQYRRKG